MQKRRLLMRFNSFRRVNEPLLRSRIRIEFGNRDITFLSSVHVFGVFVEFIDIKKEMEY